MQFKNLLFIFLLFNCLIVNAQSSGVISGTITEEDGNLSLPGAVISLSSGNRYAVTNQIGRYEFLNVPAGTYTLKVSYIGYTAQSKEVTVVANQNGQVNFVLLPQNESLDEVVIIGDRLRGQSRALNQQKNNQNITNIISSDQVGRFPDANIGDALKRVPGITMQNDQGEARNIIIRGLAPNLNSVTINGDRIPSAEGDNRNVQMDLIPSDMVSTIEVNKTLTSDMDADAIGGSVNLVTRSAPYGERISATLAGGYSSIRNGGNYTAGFVYGNRYFKDKLGAILSLSYNNNSFGSDNVEGVWVQYNKGGNKLDYIEELDIRKYDVQRIRRSSSLALDYKFNNNNSIFAKAMYNWRDDRENRFRARYRGIKPVFEGNNLTGFTGDIRMQTKGGIDDNRNKNTRLEDQRVQNYSLGGEHLLGTKVDFDWSASYSTASEDRPNERYTEFHNRGLNFSYNGDSERPLYSVLSDNSPEKYALRNITDNHDNTKESETGLKANVRFPFSVIQDQKGRLRAGVRMRLKTKDRDNIFYSYKELAGTIKNMSNVPNIFYGGDNWQSGSQYVPGTFATAEYLGGLNLNNSSLFERSLEPAEYLAENYSAKENIFATYLRWDQDFSEKLSMIAGVRLENTGIDYTGNHILDEEELEGKVTNKNNYLNVLPSLAFKYDIQDNFILRAAFSTALARPNYYALAPYVNVISEDEEILAGNPNLKSTFSYNFDLMLEKYFKSVGIVSAGAFYKSLNDFIYTYRTNNTYSNAQFSADFPGLSNPIPAGANNWSFMQQRNGENVGVYGFEVAVQRQLDFIPGAFFKGLGVYLNYTYTQSKATGITNNDGEQREGLGLPGTAPHMFNASLAWENQKFSARLSLNYTDSYLDELGGDSFEDRYYDSQLFLDANASYKLGKNLRIFAEANNLTNQPLRYFQGIRSRTMQMEYYTPRYNLGIKFDL
jgi:TonB-dependent receptor